MTGYLQDNPSGESGQRTKTVAIPALQAMRAAGEKITMLTCYEASFASLMDRCGIDILLVGDSLGNVCQGHPSTLPVALADVAYHTACVARGNKTALLIADLPFGTYPTPESTFDNSVKLMQAGAHMVKMEGGAWLAESVQFLVERGIPVCAHLGLTPQSVHQLGGHRVQAKTTAEADKLKADALALQAAGASLLVLEMIPAKLAKEVTDMLAIPTIGIGAGVDCSGQVLVMHDMLGVSSRKLRLARNFMEGADTIEAAVRAYVAAVKDKTFPTPENSF
ncbi:MAG: 3-methyl-2-oxobutanoate hydroxymethyltransferase [Burkholderiales bacterium]|nr:3-methyl-2-oxobutanoate hydroxymethyltransferase [Burkholderiales bacterium]